MNIAQLFEDFSDGILVLTDQGQVLYTNSYALAICQRIKSSPGNTPKPIWQICQIIIHSSDSTLNAEPLRISEGEYSVGDHEQIRVRVHQLRVEESDRPCLLIILEDREQMKHSAAIADVHTYHLTPREAEVWKLHRAGCGCNEIADKLYVTVDTVKKHLKSVRAKRKMSQDE